MSPQQIPAQRVMVTRTDVRIEEDRAIIVLSCGHTEDTVPISCTLEKLVEILCRHVKSQRPQPCYRCEAER